MQHQDKTNLSNLQPRMAKSLSKCFTTAVSALLLLQAVAIFSAPVKRNTNVQVEKDVLVEGGLMRLKDLILALFPEPDHEVCISIDNN